MQFSERQIEANRDYFAAKIAAEKQRSVVAKWAAEESGPGDFLLLDVRDRETFAKGHIRGALNVPVSELASLASTLPKDKELVTYCSHHY